MSRLHLYCKKKLQNSSRRVAKAFLKHMTKERLINSFESAEGLTVVMQKVSREFTMVWRKELEKCRLTSTEDLGSESEKQEVDFLKAMSTASGIRNYLIKELASAEQLLKSLEYDRYLEKATSCVDERTAQKIEYCKRHIARLKKTISDKKNLIPLAKAMRDKRKLQKAERTEAYVAALELTDFLYARIRERTDPSGQ